MVNIILANVGTVICFRTGNPADEKLMLPLFSPYLVEGDIANLPPYNFYMRASAIRSQEPLSGETIKLEAESDEDIAQQVIDASREYYATKYIPPEPKANPTIRDSTSTTKSGKRAVEQSAQPKDRLKKTRKPTVYQAAARWMMDEINRTGSLRQEAAAYYINNHFGGDCIEKTEHGNHSIAKKVRDAFKRLHRGTVVWVEEDQAWHKT